MTAHKISKNGKKIKKSERTTKSSSFNKKFLTMASIVGYLGSAFSSTSGSLALGDQVWNDKNLYDLKKEVEHVLENENENENQLHIKEQLPPFFIEKSLRQGSGDVKHSVLVCKRFLDFRKREKWPIILNIKDINMEALKSGMHWLFGDRLYIC